jgi:UDP-N-acetylmuramoyl-tripeptide--D-alanyl-D-alanine ligase
MPENEVGRRTIAVLGEMLELGDEAPAQHWKVGVEAGETGVDIVVAVGGENAKQLALGAAHAGVAGVAIVADTETAAAYVEAILEPGDVVLIKGANSNMLWQIGQRLHGEVLTDH